MADFLVLDDFAAADLPAGAILSDAEHDVDELAAGGAALLAYNPATMAEAVLRFESLPSPRRTGALVGLLAAAGAIGGGGAGTGDVVGPAGATDNTLARFNGPTGKVIQGSLVSITDTGSIVVPVGQTVDGRDVSADGVLLDATAAVAAAASGDATAALGASAANTATLAAHVGAGGSAHADATPTVAGFMSAADKTKLNGIEAGADVTDAANVDAAGAVMEADFAAQTILARGSGPSPAALAVPASTLVGRGASGNVAALTAAQVRALLNYPAAEVSYDNTTSGLAATQVQNAIDELAASSGGGQTIEYVSGFVADASTPGNRRGFTHGSDPLSAAASFTAVVIAQSANSQFFSGQQRVFGTDDGVGGWSIYYTPNAWGYAFTNNGGTRRGGAYFQPLNTRKFAVLHLRVVNVGSGADLSLGLFLDGTQIAEYYGPGESGAYTAGGDLAIGVGDAGAEAGSAFGGRVHGAGYLTSALTLPQIADHAEACIEAARLVDPPSAALTDGWRVDNGATNPGTAWASFKSGAPLAALGAPTALARAVKAAPVLWA